MTPMEISTFEGPVLYQFNAHLDIAYIVLNRPTTLNAINVELLDGLVRALKDVQVWVFFTYLSVIMTYENSGKRS